MQFESFEPSASYEPKIYRCEQRSDDWHKLHIGIPTASYFYKILTPTGRKSKQYKEYMYRLIAEKLLGEHLRDKAETDKANALYWMSRGINMEEHARDAFRQKSKLELDLVGFVTTPFGRLGCSPDALVVGKKQAVEIKAPAPWTQIQYLLDGPGLDYRPQVQGQLMIGGWECVHFFAFNPRMPQKYVITEPDLDYTATLRQALQDFVGEMDRELQKAHGLGKYIRREEIMNLRE